MSERENNNNTNPDIFQSLGQAVANIPADELMQRVIENSTTYSKRQAEALEDIRNELGHLVKLLKPWAERERRLNIMEQDPDYWLAMNKQVKDELKKNKKLAPALKAKAKKKKVNRK